MTATPLDASLCPLCGRSNRCAVTAGTDAHACWCMNTPISSEALARIPDDARGLACLCPSCAVLVATPGAQASQTPRPK